MPALQHFREWGLEREVKVGVRWWWISPDSLVVGFQVANLLVAVVNLLVAEWSQDLVQRKLPTKRVGGGYPTAI